MGNHVDKSGTKGTPNRVAKMYDELLSGYATDINKLLNNALFEVKYDEMVVVKDIDFFLYVSTTCFHFMEP